MGNDVSRARYLTLSSFLVNFGVQSYGMLTSPNMKDVADANHYAFSPSPWFIAALFSGQMILQLAWIRQLFKLDPVEYGRLDAAPSSAALAQDETENLMDTSDEVESVWTSIAYAPFYALGNLCIAGWLLFWLREDFIGSQILVMINTIAQLYAVARLPAITSNSTGLMVLTHLVAKTFAGIGVLDFIDNGGVALRYNAPPSTLIQALTYALFPLAATVSTPFFGSVLLYDVLAIFVGQRSIPAAGLWSTRLGWTALAMGGIIGVKAFLARKKI